MILFSLALAAVTFTVGFVSNTAILPMPMLLVAAPVMIASCCVSEGLWETALLVFGAMLLSTGHY